MSEGDNCADCRSQLGHHGGDKQELIICFKIVSSKKQCLCNALIYRYTPLHYARGTEM